MQIAKALFITYRVIKSQEEKCLYKTEKKLIMALYCYKYPDKIVPNSIFTSSISKFSLNYL